MKEATATVGNHHVNGKQCSVPTDVLDELDAEPGDELEFFAVENGCVVTVL